MRLVPITIVIIFCISALIVTGVRTFGIATTPRPEQVMLVLPDDGCDAPCWQGVNTNNDSHQATVERLNALPQSTQEGIIEWTFGTEEERMRVRLENGRSFVIQPIDPRNGQGVRLGDLLVALGAPDGQLTGTAIDRIRAQSEPYVSFIYSDERVIYAALAPNNDRLSPYSRIDYILYPASLFPDVVEEEALAWSGFLPLNVFPSSAFSAPIIIE